MERKEKRQGKRKFRSIKDHALMRGPSGRMAVGAEGFEAMRAAGHWSLGGKGGGCCCDIDIVRDLRIGDGDAGVLERYDGTAGVADR